MCLLSTSLPWSAAAALIRQKQQFPDRQQSLSILLVSCKTDQSQSILSCPLGNNDRGAVVYIQ